jgi:hypothetical protein
MNQVLDPNLAVGFVIWLIALLIIAVVALVLFGWLLYRSGQLSHPAPLIVSLSLLTAVGLVGGLILQNTDALNLAAVGFGALAGSLAVVYRGSKPPNEAPEPPTPAPETPEE